MSQQLVVRPENTEASLVATLKSLELTKTLGDEPVLTALKRFPAEPPRYADFPEELDVRLLAVLKARGLHAALHAPARGLRRGAGGGELGGGDAHGLGQDALLQPPGSRPHPEGSRCAGAVPVSDQGPRPGPARRAVRHDRSAGRRHRHLHLRRRHAARRAQGDPRARPRGGHEPRHAPQGDPAAPHQVGEAVREPAVRDRRRAALAARRLRLARRQHPAAAAAALPLLRLLAAVPVLVGDDRQPEGAGRGAHRPQHAPDRRERRAARREVLRDLQPARGEPAARDPQVRTRTRPATSHCRSWARACRRSCSRPRGSRPRCSSPI